MVERSGELSLQLLDPHFESPEAIIYIVIRAVIHRVLQLSPDGKKPSKHADRTERPGDLSNHWLTRISITTSAVPAILNEASSKLGARSRCRTLFETPHSIFNGKPHYACALQGRGKAAPPIKQCASDAPL